MPRPTIDDIANYAGVSKAAVSYVLSGKKKLTQEVEEKILDAVRVLNYVPPQNITRIYPRTKMINMCIALERGGLSEDIYYLSMIDGVMDYVAKENYQFILTRLVPGDECSQKLFFNSLNFVDGVILCNPRSDHLFEAEIKKCVPYVIIGTTHDMGKAYYVDVDMEGIGYQAVNFLVKKGHRDIFKINLAESMLQSQQRLAGFKYGYETNNLEWDEADHCFLETNMDDSYRKTLALLDRPGKKCTAIITSNEIQAQGVMRALKERKISVPSKMAVMSMGGTILSSIGYPLITTINFDPYKMGYESAHLLVDVLTKKRLRFSNIVLPGDLVEREST